MHFKTQLLNMAFYVLTALLLFGIVKYVRAALMLQTAFFMVVGLANYYVLNFRSAPIMPWDIYSISTAASVAGNFNYELSTSTILVIVGFLISHEGTGKSGKESGTDPVKHCLDLWLYRHDTE